MAFELIGKLHKKYDTENKSDTFQAREFVVEIMDGNYQQYIKFQLVQDRCSLVDSYEEGEQVKVHFDLRGREWQGRYFTNLNAWRLEKVEEQAAAPEATAPVGDFPSAADEPVGQGTDDLPF